MLTKRIIACLDVNGGRVVKGVKFLNLRDAGDPAELAGRTRRAAPTKSCCSTSRPPARSARRCSKFRHGPAFSSRLTVGGGIRSLDEATAVFDAEPTRSASTPLPEDPR